MKSNLANNFVLLFSLLAVCSTSHAEIVSGDNKVNGAGEIRFTYDNERADACRNLALIGVGTGMSASDYTMVASSIATGHDIVVVMMDHSPRWFVKTSETKFAKLANAVIDQLSTLIPACASTIKPSKIAIGGHSASGQAAWNSRSLLTFQPDGFVGLDPFDLEKSSHIEVPTIDFGFSKTTCSVKTEQAAKAGYNKSNATNRVLFRIHNSDNKLTHCSFADKGCMGPICPAGESSELVRESVGKGINLFFQSLHSQVYDRDVYALGASPQLAVTLYLNADDVLEETAATMTTTSTQNVRLQPAVAGVGS